MNKEKKNLNILIIAAHPDDELLGCAGTVRKYIENGAKVVSVILGEGMTSRGDEMKDKLEGLHKDAHEANQVVGIETVHIENLPDNRFDSVPLLDVVKIVEKYVDQYKPDIIFTHFPGDLNIDHGITYQAVMTACRPQPGFGHPDIYCFEVASATDFNDVSQNDSFVPNVYEDISKQLEIKLKALKAYKTEMREYPHTRSIEGIKILAKYRGVKVGLEAAEGFMLIRKING